MGLSQIGSGSWSFVTVLALSELAALVFLIYLRKLRRRRWLRGASADPVGVELRSDPKRVSREIERLCSGKGPNELPTKQMSAADRALFEVSIIDALNSRTREGQHQLRSALIKCGYDEHCARRVMSEDLSDRVRATALLNLLRPQWRDAPLDADKPTSGELAAQSRAPGRADPD
jgi:hypothetical protein